MTVSIVAIRNSSSSGGDSDTATGAASVIAVVVTGEWNEHRDPSQLQQLIAAMMVVF